MSLIAKARILLIACLVLSVIVCITALIMRVSVTECDATYDFTTSTMMIVGISVGAAASMGLSWINRTQCT